MITREQALTENRFHDATCANWRRNGATQTWKTRPNDFRVPVKFDMYTYGQIWHFDAPAFHVPSATCKRNVW